MKNKNNYKFTNDNNYKLYEWCIKQTANRYMGLLSPQQIAKLDGIKFPWDYYEKQLDGLGFDWKKNAPKAKEKE